MIDFTTRPHLPKKQQSLLKNTTSDKNMRLDFSGLLVLLTEYKKIRVVWQSFFIPMTGQTGPNYTVKRPTLSTFNR